MIIKTLVENTSISKDFANEHGLSLYIETKKHKILFDVGASDLFLENAKKLNVKISDIDYLIISHGHYDHGGGLSAFLEKNNKAEVFLHRHAFDKHYVRRSNDELDFIGLEEDLKENKQLIATSDRFFIWRGVQVFSNSTKKSPQPESNEGLLAEHDGQIVADTFVHEQNLVIEEDGKTLLVTGCAHNGIENILEHFYKLNGYMPSYVIGGLHLSSRLGPNVDSHTLNEIADYLNSTKAKFYTGHCTGIEPYENLKSIMGDNIEYISTGSKFSL